MPVFYLKVRTGGAALKDPFGVELPDAAAAAIHARNVASDLIRNNERCARSWQIDVHDDRGAVVFELPFTAVDWTLNLLPAQTKDLMTILCQRKRALAEACTAARHSVQQARATLARAKGKPYLIVGNGRDLRHGSR